MATASKRKKEWKKEVDRTKRYDLPEAVQLIKKFAKAKFDERVDVAFRLGIDPRKSDQMVRGSCSLPNGTGKPFEYWFLQKATKKKKLWMPVQILPVEKRSSKKSKKAGWNLTGSLQLQI